MPTGCADDRSNDEQGQEGSGPTDKQFSTADVEFAQQMIPHHRQAVEMAMLAEERASSADVTSLAAEIKAAQDPEIKTMTGWLNAWNAEVPEDDSDMEDMDHGEQSTDRMPGAMSAEDMQALEAASGGQFDQKFLTMMIVHHRGAIEMADREVADGVNSDAVELARKISADQQAEIDTMRGILDQ